MVTAETASRRQAPAARVGANPGSLPALRVSGPAGFSVTPPIVLANLDYVGEEKDLRHAAHVHRPLLEVSRPMAYVLR